MAKTFKVRELLETPYVYLTPLNDLRYLLENSLKALKTGETFHTPSDLQDEFVKAVVTDRVIPTLDLAGTYLTDIATEYICSCQLSNPISFIDSEDEGRQRVLDANVEYKNTIQEPTTDLPKITYAQKIEDYILQLDPTKLYRITSEGEEIVYAVVLFCMAVRPDIRFQLSNVPGIKFLEWIHKHLEHSDCMQFTSFIAIYSHAKRYELDTVTYDINTGNIEVRQGMHITYPIAWQYLKLVPNIFNEPDFYNKYKSILESIFTYSLDTIKDYYNSAPRDLYDLLQAIPRKE